MHEIGQYGVLLENNGVTTEAFTVNHCDIEPAYGYGITAPDGTIFFSGDTTCGEILIKKAKGVDVLVREVISEEGWKALTPDWREYRHSAHTLTSELADFASQTRPGVLVLPAGPTATADRRLANALG